LLPKYYSDISRSSLNLSNSGTGLNLSWLYSYNGRGDLTGMTTPYSEAVNWSYLDNGWLSSQTTQAAVTSFSYKALGQLTDLNNSHGGVRLSDFNRTGSGHYDGAGNLLGQTATLPGAPYFTQPTVESLLIVISISGLSDRPMPPTFCRTGRKSLRQIFSHLALPQAAKSSPPDQSRPRA
jgi:YD repeat-containing protein